ncbi:aminoglycoside phosphotransferase family protein [Palleronia abyssalis]|uniref:Aminoglycoside phosphotransferase domain-containing protein n=1 Tax=Palleronia abyssalis TaxID=1501240 RepID=A0A2R8BSU0_9RHOB|nr:phosphotransferase [Palleronia abyssalis]SPJ23195.1 hypothetical protein PAA8504_01000 [Palleronia abyssalis]
MLDDFLNRHGWSDAVREPLAGDASTRRYTRLRKPAARAILMDSDATPVAPFLRVQQHLATIGLTAPRIFAVDEVAGLILLEDLGDDTFAALIQRGGDERALYEAATDLLVSLHRSPAPAWAETYSPAKMAAFLAPAWDHCVAPEDKGGCHRIETVLRDLLDHTWDDSAVLLHRDYHAENLIWLPGRGGDQRVGLLDFQDALAGHPAYDLASLLQDARRDVDPALEDAMIVRFCAATGRDPARFRAAYTLQALQRHTRILGIFAKLAVTRGKPGYLAMMPRVRAHMKRCLSHPIAEPLRAPIEDILLKPAYA